MDRLEKIQEFISEKHYNEAKSALKEYIEENKNNIEAIKLQGLVNVNLELYEEAKKDFEYVVKKYPDDATALFYLASCYDKLDDIVNAEKFYKKVLEIRENYIDAYKDLCVIYLRTNRELDAIETAKKASKLAVNDYVFYYMIGTAYIAQKEYTKGIEYLDAALRLNPNHFQIYNNLGTAYLLIGQRDKAIDCYKKAVKIKPDDAISYYNIGSIYQIQQKHKQASDYFEKAYNLENNENYLVSLALSELKSGHIEDAVKHYKALVLLHPEKDSFQYNLASCYELLKNYEQAIIIMKRLLSRNPKSITMAHKLATLYIEIRQFRQAKELYDSIILKSAPSADILYQYAILSTQLYDTGTAEKIFKKVIKMEPENALAHKDLGVIYLNQRLFDYADEEFNKALELEPDNFDIVFEYANYLYAISKYEQADEYYSKALNIKDDVVAKSLSAINKLELNDIDSARALIESSLADQPEHEYIQFLAGRIYYYMKDFELAKTYFIKSIEQNPDAETKNFLALTYYELGEYENALNIFNALLEKSKSNISLLLNKAKCLEKLDKVDDSLSVLDELTEIFPECEEAHEMIRRIS